MVMVVPLPNVLYMHKSVLVLEMLNSRIIISPTISFIHFRSQSEHYWTAVIGEFDLTKADPDEQAMKVNRIIIHPKVHIHLHQYLAHYTFGVDSFAGIA